MCVVVVVVVGFVVACGAEGADPIGEYGGADWFFLGDLGPVFGKGGRHGLGVAGDTTVLLANNAYVVGGSGEHAFKFSGNVVAFFFPVLLGLLLFLRCWMVLSNGGVVVFRLSFVLELHHFLRKCLACDAQGVVFKGVDAVFFPGVRVKSVSVAADGGACFGADGHAGHVLLLGGSDVRKYPADLVVAAFGGVVLIRFVLTVDNALEGCPHGFLGKDEAAEWRVGGGIFGEQVVRFRDDSSGEVRVVCGALRDSAPCVFVMFRGGASLWSERMRLRGKV